MLITPTKSTLSRYGLSLEAWEKLRDEQKNACYVCQKEPTKGRLCIDHEHVKGWKKMPPEQRVLYVRGLLCWVCNHYYLGRGITIEKAKRVVTYLEDYKTRRPPGEKK
jgi:hypothetical protein